MEDQQSLRLVFAGTPEFAAEHLRELLKSTHTVIGVYTQPDRPAGRGKKLSPSPVKQVALEAGIQVFQPASLKSADEQNTLNQLEADVMIVVAYGLLLPSAILSTPKYGCLNVHASLLPRWRGAAPIQRAIEAGDTESGVTIMQMDEGLDTGDMLCKVTCPVKDDDTASSLHDRLATLGPPALLSVLDQLSKGATQAETQNNAESNYAKKLQKSEALITWQDDAQSICRKIRAFNPAPGCYSYAGDKRFRILFAIPLTNDENIVLQAQHKQPGEVLAISAKGLLVACGNGVINILELQSPGKKSMTISQFYNGHAQLIKTGDVFASPPA